MLARKDEGSTFAVARTCRSSKMREVSSAATPNIICESAFNSRTDAVIALCPVCPGRCANRRSTIT